MKIGIFGGSFDPPHIGHEKIAIAAVKQFDLDRLVLLPVGTAYYKQSAGASPVCRYNMCEIVAKKHGFCVSDVEVFEENFTYTCDTLKYFKQKYIGGELYFILGSDSLDYIESWKNPEQIFSLCTVICARRKGYSDKAQHLEKKYGAKIFNLDLEPVDVSSSEIRKSVRDGSFDFSCVDKEVANYIMQNNLYKSYDLEFLKREIKPLLKCERYQHSLGVMQLSGALAEHYNVDKNTAQAAAILHDCTKNIDFETMHEYMTRAGNIDEIIETNKGLWHGPASAQYAKEHFDISDEIFDAIFYHTIGKPDMNMLAKIVFLADVLEVGRDKEFDFSKPFRKKVFEDIDKTLVEVLNLTIISLIKRNMVIHPNCVALRNKLISK